MQLSLSSLMALTAAAGLWTIGWGLGQWNLQLDEPAMSIAMMFVASADVLLILVILAGGSKVLPYVIAGGIINAVLVLLRASHMGPVFGLMASTPFAALAGSVLMLFGREQVPVSRIALLLLSALVAGWMTAFLVFFH